MASTTNVSDFREKLKKLKEQRKQASRSNFKEVLEENAQAKRPQNWEKRLERDQKKLLEEEERQKAEADGQDYTVKKSMNLQADQLDKWDKMRSSKKRQSSEFIDFETATRRQYDRLTKQMKPDMEAYNALREEMGDEKFYAKAGLEISKNELIKDSKEGVDRMVADVNKQIETRSKRSRRRRFDDEADVDYINERNMKFNQKLERFYGEHTNEIKQNFERGTAL